MLIDTHTSRQGAIPMREGLNRLKTTCERRTKINLAESQFLKRSNCHSIKVNHMKQNFASFITKPLKYKVCSNLSAAVSYKLKILHIFAVLFSANISIQSLEIFTFFPNFRLLKSGWLILIFEHSVLRV